MHPYAQSRTAVMFTYTGDYTGLLFLKVKINLHNYLLFYCFGLVLQNILFVAECHYPLLTDNYFSCPKYLVRSLILIASERDEK